MGRAPGGEFWGTIGRKKLTTYYGYLAAKQIETMHNFVYLAKLGASLVKHEEKLGCSACLFA